MKINRLKIHNFKIFDDVEIDFRENAANVFCGKNGFGKTSVFDALELLFTGRIKRYADWVEKCHNAQLHFDTGKPLVHDESTKEDVYITAEIEFSEGVFCITRKEAFSNIRNPLNFDYIFNDIYCVRRGSEVREQIPQEFLSVASTYNILNYQSQEQATDFLKSKEEERTSVISILFQTKAYDDIIDRLTKGRKTLDGISRDYEGRYKAIQDDIDKITKHFTFQKGQAAQSEYQRLFVKDGIEWDKEYPSTSISDVEAIIAKDGELDRLQYYLHHREEYGQYLINKSVEYSLANDLHNVVTYLLKGKSQERLIKEYADYKHLFVDKYATLSLDNIGKTTIKTSPLLNEYLEDEVIANLEERRQTIVRTISSCDKLQNAYSQILQSRNVMASSISVLNVSDCPLCGHSYQSKEELLKTIGDYDEVLKEHTKKIGETVSVMFDDFKKIFFSKIIQPLERHFVENSITNDFYQQYILYKRQENDRYVAAIINRIGENVDLHKSIEDLKNDIQAILVSWTNDVDSKIEVEILNSIHSRYSKYIGDGITDEMIEAKRQYLISICSRQGAKYLQTKNAEKKKVEKVVEAARRKSKYLHDILAKVKNQRSEYVKQLISDIEILFYIYSGRIMQDSSYGRGVFMKMFTSARERQRLIFVSGKYDSQVDVLYNMSSGQLVSIAIAFLLSLNKLYDNSKFLAIDDPVQTIDDINFWGLIETIRHEFYGYNLFVSTHEDNYASLLRYKLENLGVRTKAYDMKNINYRQHQQ